MMQTLILMNVRIFRWAGCALLLFQSLYAYSQEACDCPAVNECSACLDGITSLKLKYTGSDGTTVNISVDDQLTTVYSDNVEPGDTIVVSGSPPNGKFVGNKLTIREEGVITATINVSCNPPIHFNDLVGSFLVIGGTSKTGGSICCDPAKVERISPEISNCPSNVLIELPEGECGAVVSWAEPVVSDNCAVVTLTSSHQSGDTFPSGTTRIIYTATDKYANTSTCQFDVVIHEGQPPTFENCPGDITVTADATCQAQVNWQVPVAADNCGLDTVYSSHQPGDAFEIGTTIVTYTATDRSGNTTSCQFSVTVNDVVPPTLSDCPSNVSVVAASARSAIAEWLPPTVSDDCSTVALSSTHEPGDAFPVGTTVVTYVATDASGNRSQCEFEINVRYENFEADIQRVMTPDGDGINDKWILSNIEHFKDNNVTIFDRWGGVVFSGDGYDNESVVWKGQNTSGALLPTGTYFYAIKISTGTGILETRGFIELIRSR